MPRRVSRAWLVRIRNSDSGVVIRMSGGRVDEPATIGRAGVAGPEPDGDLGQRGLEPVGGVADAGQGCAEVALDVDGERLERADVEHARAPGLLLGRALGEQLVDREEEGAERLAAAGRRDHERVPAVRDRVPRALLGRRRGGEGSLEPRARRGAEVVEGGHGASLAYATDSGHTVSA